MLDGTESQIEQTTKYEIPSPRLTQTQTKITVGKVNIEDSVEFGNINGESGVIDEVDEEKSESKQAITDNENNAEDKSVFSINDAALAYEHYLEKQKTTKNSPVR